MIIIRCKIEAKDKRELSELQEFISTQTAEDVVVVPNDCEVIYTDDPDAQVIIDDEEEAKA
ncbi:MAG: hypothetical protein MJZ52_07185 [Bacteroidales bacterium]|nr:hypothetical protein [Bacteroidales bacterium]